MPETSPSTPQIPVLPLSAPIVQDAVGRAVNVATQVNQVFDAALGLLYEYQYMDYANADPTLFDGLDLTKDEFIALMQTFQHIQTLFQQAPQLRQAIYHGRRRG